MSDCAIGIINTWNNVLIFSDTSSSLSVKWTRQAVSLYLSGGGCIIAFKIMSWWNTEIWWSSAMELQLLVDKLKGGLYIAEPTAGVPVHVLKSGILPTTSDCEHTCGSKKKIEETH